MISTLIHFPLVLKSYVHPLVNSLGKVIGDDWKKLVLASLILPANSEEKDYF